MDLYAVLGIKPTASPADIRRAYRRLARKYHPDVNPGDPAAEARYQQIVDAYETLIDPERRARYDDSGVGVERPSETTFGFEGFDFSVTAVEGPRASTFGDLFAEVIQRGLKRSAEGGERGADLHARIEIPFEDAMVGIERRVAVVRTVTCSGCHGTGVVPTSESPCLHCGGTGSIRSARGHMVFTKRCPHCSGTGRRRHQACGRCAGHGLETRGEAVAVRMPAGVADGEQVRVPGAGNCGRGGTCGDLYVTVQVQPHALFRREGDDLLLQVPVAVHEAALGAKVDIPTLEGAARLRVPPGTQSGHRFRLRERGVVSRDARRRGDMVVEIRIVLPALLDERSREILREFGRANPDDVRARWWRPAPSEPEPTS